jgi:hypothetical protein
MNAMEELAFRCGRAVRFILRPKLADPMWWKTLAVSMCIIALAIALVVYQTQVALISLAAIYIVWKWPESPLWVAVGILRVVLGLMALCVYLLPTYVAWIQEQPNIIAIAIINVTLGWTVLGWIVALVMAVWV